MKRDDGPRRLLALLLAAGALALAAAAVSPAWAVDPEELKSQTVMIDVTRQEGGPEPGSGIVLCEDEGRIFVLTARHVLFGEAPPGGQAPGIRSVTGIRIAFYRDLVPAIEEDRTKGESGIATYYFKDKDLMVLVAPVSRTVPVAAVVGKPPSAAELGASQLGIDREVHAIGRSKLGATWRESTGELLRHGEELLLHSAPIEPGYSGGPLFNKAGALIGVNLGTLEEDGGAGEGPGPAAGRLARAVPIDDALETIYKLVPATCLKSEDLPEKAWVSYRQGMTALGRHRWAEAAELMRQAIAARSREGGTVHLQGMRYTTYLPHYHLGLALYERGRRAAAAGEHDRAAELLDQALNEWALSQVQGAIRGDKRFARLAGYQKRCRRLYQQEQLATLPAAGR